MEKITKQLAKIEEKRGSKVIYYVTGERQPLQHLATQVALDVLPIFHNFLEEMGSGQEKITLILNTGGGNINTPWPLVNLIKEYTKEFEVIVLEKALSAGTLIALGADKIVMSEFSQLSPIDPAANYMEGNQKVKLEIEDTIGYIDFLKQKVGITEQNALAELTKELTKEIKPTRLGSVNRTYSLVRNLANNLLALHKKPISQRDMKDIVEHLTEKLYSHEHLINRSEAKKIGFSSIIDFIDDDTKKLTKKLWDDTKAELQLDVPFDPIQEIAEETSKSVVVSRSILSSAKTSYLFNTTFLLTKTPDMPPGQVQVSHIKSNWEK